MSFSLADALKGVSELDTGREQIEYIRLNLIDSDANNFYQLSEIEGLADNISLCGLQQPIRVRQNPENPERYTIVSGHRRRAAIELLAEEDPDKWQEVPCIVERDAVSPALQQLRLIYANSSTRKLTPAEISEQAVQVEKLLYQLKEEEGYEFPGRMRDHVAEACSVSKSKLARLKVIRENLDASWVDDWKEGQLTESQAYELAQLPKYWQYIIKDNWKYAVTSLYADRIKRLRERFDHTAKLQCQHGLHLCEHSSVMMGKIIKDDYGAYCHGCCFDCDALQGCKNCCPEAAGKKKELKAVAKQANLDAKREQEERDRPGSEFARMVWDRIGKARERSGCSIKDLVFARGESFYNEFCDDPKQKRLELGNGHYSPNSLISFGYHITASEMMKVVAVADALQCSVDYLLGRTDYPELVKEAPLEKVSNSDIEEKAPSFIPAAWYAADCVEPPVGKKLILMDSGGYVDTGKYKGCGEFDMDYGDPVVLWTPMPEEKDVVTESPPMAGWQGGTPKAYGTYIAYIRLDGVSLPMLRELLWDGEEWFLFGEKISEDVMVQCWAERPDF